MTTEEIKTAVDNGQKVYLGSPAYEVIKDTHGQYLIRCIQNNHCIGLTWNDGVTLNGNPEQFYLQKTLDDLLEEWSVLFPGGWENENTETLGDWYAVANNDGIIAYFGHEQDALAFRLMMINVILNSRPQ